MSDLKRSTAHDVLRLTGNPLDVLFSPQSVAVIGATEREGSIGRIVTSNLLATSFGGTIFPVNPGWRSVLGLKAYARLAHMPDEIDLAIIATPAESVPDLVSECVEVGAKACVILSGGFKEIGEKGAQREQDILKRAGKMRIVGPNCLGILNPYSGLNASFAARMARPGSVGFVSQSGALCSAVLDWSFRENVGFSAFVSIGSMLDVGWGDLIYYFGDDPHTKSIVIYMESIGDARSFLSAAREVALTKPIIVIKPGRTAEAAQAAAAHTGSETGSDEVLGAAFRRCGVLRVEQIEDLFNMAEILAKQPRVLGKRLAIVTNAGGPGVLAADALAAGGGRLAPISDELRTNLDAFLPEHWSHSNPIDILGDAGADRFRQTIELVKDDAHNDGVLAILTPQAMSAPVETARVLRELYDRPAGYPYGKPILASWMGGANAANGAAVLNKANIPTFPYPDAAARAFNAMWRFQQQTASLYETPRLTSEYDEKGFKRFLCGETIADLRSAGRVELKDAESKRILEAYGISTASTESGVETNLTPNHDLRLEFSLSSWVDKQLGPVLCFGVGGEKGRIYDDRAVGIPPLNTTLAKLVMERTKVFRAICREERLFPQVTDALVEMLVLFSRLVVEQRWIRRVTIDPISIINDTLVAAAANIQLFAAGIQENELPRLAIRPYPTQYVQPYTNKQGETYLIRPIRPEDEPKVAQFHAHLSEKSVYLRYFRAFQLSRRVEHERLTRICFVDYDRTIALVVETTEPDSKEGEIVAIGRLTRMPDPKEAEYSILVRDDFQGHGLGSTLLKRLLQFGRDEGIQRVIAYMLGENKGMIKVSKNLGFSLEREDDLVKAVILLP